MSRRPAWTMAVCAAVSLLGGVSLCACGSSSASAELSKYAWAVGDGGRIVATTDGGQHWLSQHSGTNLDLIGVAFADASHGWTVGFNGGSSTMTPTVILATTDGGAHWTAQMQRRSMYLQTVTCVDSQHAWALGAGGVGGNTSVLMATTDGGTTWTRESTAGPANTIRAVTFADALHGWALGYPGKTPAILATTDGGAHWAVQKLLPKKDELDAISCTDSQHCWVGGRDTTQNSFPPGISRLWSTSDGGPTWVSLPVPQDSNDGLSSLAPLRGSWLVAADEDGTWVTSDAGSQWTPAKPPNPAVNALAFSDTTRGWAAVVRHVLRTTDGGLTWTSAYAETEWNLNDVACPRVGQ